MFQKKNVGARLPDIDLGKIFIRDIADVMHMSPLGTGKLLKGSHFWDSVF